VPFLNHHFFVGLRARMLNEWDGGYPVDRCAPKKSRLLGQNGRYAKRLRE